MTIENDKKDEPLKVVDTRLSLTMDELKELKRLVALSRAARLLMVILISLLSLLGIDKIITILEKH